MAPDEGITREQQIATATEREKATKRRLKAGEDFEAMMINIAASGLSAHKWLEENPTTQDQLEVMYLHGELADSIEKTSSGYTIKSATLAIGTILASSALPEPSQQSSVSVSVYNEETYQYETKAITIKNEEGKYFQIENEKKHKLEIGVDDRTITKEMSFADSLEAKVAEFKKENDLESAIKEKNFALINRCIKNGIRPDDNQIIALMRLSACVKAGGTERTPTFLHELLDPVRGISDSKHVLPLLKRAKALLSDFEFKALLELSDGTKPARELITSLDKKIYADLNNILPPNPDVAQFVAEDGQSTHTETVHASVDLSAARLYDRFHERHSDSVTASTSTERGVTTVSRTPEFKALVDTKVKELQAKIAAELALPDADLDKKLKDGKIDKSVKDYRFELGAAKRLVDDCVAGEKMHHYNVDFNAPSGNGITLKETLAMVYDALSDDDNLTFTGGSITKELDKVGHFSRLITTLKETRRGYNANDTEAEDQNKCPGGCMNHLVYALQGVYNDRIVDVASVSKGDIAREANTKANEFLLLYLRNATGTDQEILRLAIAKIKFGMKPKDVLDPAILTRLQTDVKKVMQAQYGRYFKDESYLTNIAATAQNLSITQDTAKQLGQVDYAAVIPDPKDFMQEMEKGAIPLYTRTENGYELSLEVIKKANPEYYRQLITHIIDSKDVSAFRDYLKLDTKGLSVFRLKGNPSEETLREARDINPVIFKEVAKKRFVAQDCNKGLLKSFSNIDSELKSTCEYIGACIKHDPEEAIRAIKALSDEQLGLKDNKDKTVLHFAVEYGHTEIALALIVRMTPEQVALKGKDGDTALHLAAEKGHTEIALALINKMTPEQLVLRGKDRVTALHNATSGRYTDIALALIAKMTQEQVASQDTYGITALHEAINYRSTDIALALIAKMTQEQLASKNNNSETALHYAAFDGRTDIAKALIAKMTSDQLASKNVNGSAALHIAAFQGHTEIAKVLINEMTLEQLALPSKNGKTALHIAASQGHTEIALAMIARMTPDQLLLTDKDGRTAMYLATEKGHTEIAKALIAQMTPDQLSLTDKDGYTALHYAALKGRTEIAKALIEKMTTDQLSLTNKDGNTALHLAIEGGKTDIAKALIEKMTQEQLVSKGAGGKTALHLAAFQGHTEIAKALIDKMTQEQLVSNGASGKTALHLAASQGHTEIAKALIDEMTPEQLALPSKDGSTALHYATSYGRTEIAAALIDQMTPDQLASKDEDGKTALHLAAINGRTEIAKTLIARMTPEQVALKGKDGNTALHLAVSKDHAETTKALIEKMTPEQLALPSKDGKTALHFAALYGRTDIAKALINEMTLEQLALPSKDGETALHFAALQGYTEIAKALIDEMTPEQLALPKKDGSTALRFAAFQGHTEIAKALIDQMTPDQLASKGAGGKTALHLAAEKGHTEIAKTLIARMTPEQVALKDKDGNTALHYATSYGRTEIAKALTAKIESERERSSEAPALAGTLAAVVAGIDPTILAGLRGVHAAGAAAQADAPTPTTPRAPATPGRQ